MIVAFLHAILCRIVGHDWVEQPRPLSLLAQEPATRFYVCRNCSPETLYVGECEGKLWPKPPWGAP